MFKIPTKYLLLVNGLLWTAIGIKIALIGMLLGIPAALVAGLMTVWIR